MKKTLSLIMSLIMAISCMSIGMLNASAAETVPQYYLGDTFEASYDCSASSAPVYYAKFIPETTGYFEFELDTRLGTTSDEACLETYIYNSLKEEIGWNIVFSESEETATVAAKLTKGKTYYFAMYGEDIGVYTTNVTIKAHKHELETITGPAYYYTEYDFIEDGKKFQYCTICGYMKTLETIYSPKTISLSKSSYTYDGKNKKPTVTIKDRKGNKISSSNYTVKYAKNKNVGTATVTVTFNDKRYSGSMSKTFKINPKGTTISSVSAKSKGFTVKWKKQSTQATGYQVQYSTSSKFSKATTKTIVGTRTTSKTISSLKAKKKYYVRVRTYKTAGDKKYYSSWSKSKTITTKK